MYAARALLGRERDNASESRGLVSIAHLNSNMALQSHTEASFVCSLSLSRMGLLSHSSCLLQEKSVYCSFKLFYVSYITELPL